MNGGRKYTPYQLVNDTTLIYLFLFFVRNNSIGDTIKIIGLGGTQTTL